MSGAEIPALSPSDGAAIAAAFRRAPELAPPPDLERSLRALASADPAAREAASEVLAAAARSLASAEHGVVRDPHAIDHDWHLREPYDAAADFEAARLGGRIAAWAAALPRRDPAYLALVAERGRYQAMRARGGWAPLGPGPELKQGAAGARVAALRVRLAAEGYLAAGSPNPGLFDAALAAALADFQTHHRTKPDGVLNARTQQALDTPVEARIAALDANLERARWLPDVLPADRIEVDLAGAHMTLLQGGLPVLTMRAIVGDVRHKTPMFASNVVAVVFNPPWVVPASIASAELYPKERRHPGYFARNGFYVTGGQLIQRAGPKAALGYLKFDMTDPYGVYLHDTPARSLFAQHHRALSHGCMRLQSPRDLAAALLARQGWCRADVDTAIDAKVTRRVALAAPFPVYVVYRTAQASADGKALFRRDVYGWDVELDAALARK